MQGRMAPFNVYERAIWLRESVTACSLFQEAHLTHWCLRTIVVVKLGGIL